MGSQKSSRPSSARARVVGLSEGAGASSGNALKSACCGVCRGAANVASPPSAIRLPRTIIRTARSVSAHPADVEAGEPKRVTRARLRRSLQLLDSDVLVPSLDLAAAVGLQADQPIARDRRVGLGVVDRLPAVDRQPDSRPFRADLIVVPIAALQDLVDQLRLGRDECLVTPRLVIEAAPVLVAEIRLIADHLVRRLLEPPAAELYAAVDEAFGSHQLELDAKHEIAVRA